MEAPKRVVLDTVVLIKHLRGQLQGLMASLNGRSEIATTIVNAFELYYGAHKSKEVRKNLASAKGLLGSIDVLDFDDGAAEKSGQVLARLESIGLTLDPRDIFIGCIALENGYSVLTMNRRHLERIPDLLVIEPSDLKL